jgi:ATP-binding cassette subfamily B protein
MIAHGLSTVRQARCIHVVEAGQIVESGDHEALLALDGSYAALWRLQTGERLA